MPRSLGAAAPLALRERAEVSGRQQHRRTHVRVAAAFSRFQRQAVAGEDDFPARVVGSLRGRRDGGFGDRGVDRFAADQGQHAEQDQHRQGQRAAGELGGKAHGGLRCCVLWVMQGLKHQPCQPSQSLEFNNLARSDRCPVGRTVRRLSAFAAPDPGFGQRRRQAARPRGNHLGCAFVLSTSRINMLASRRPRLLPLALAIGLATAMPAALANPDAAPSAGKATVDIPFEQFTLPNGLRVVVHTDHKAPIVAVNLWYHVGSKDEPAGRSGFAHLFEHLMFQSSENHKGEYFTPFKQVGVTDQNGTTNQDRTNYFENVPTTALDTALWMESDRMGHLVGAIDEAALTEQRGVVQNEKRQGENQPYGRSYDALLKSIYPKDHPYHHTVIGSMNDLDAASLETVKDWFRSWYGPNNAVLVLAGDIDLATAKEKVAKYFGDIPASATVPKLKPMIAPRSTST